MNTEILNHTNAQKYTLIISSTDSHATHHCIWTHPYIIHKRIYFRDYFNIIFYALLLVIYLQGPILELLRNKLSYAIDVETIYFYSPFQLEVLLYCLITFNLSCISETLDLCILKHVVKHVCKQIWMLLFIICQCYYIISLLYRFHSFLDETYWCFRHQMSTGVCLRYVICRPTSEFDNLYSN